MIAVSHGEFSVVNIFLLVDSIVATNDSQNLKIDAFTNCVGLRLFFRDQLSLYIIASKQLLRTSL